MGYQGAVGTEIPRETRKWAMFCHLSALVGLLFNGIGFLLGPLFVWLMNKDVHPFIDHQGKEAVNFQITMFIVLFACVPLLLVVVGLFIMIAVAFLMTILPVVAAMKAVDGIPYRYPLTIRFIK